MFPNSSFSTCGFFEQSLVPGRATIVSPGRDDSTAVRLHTEPGDSNVAGSGTSERDDLALSSSASACSQGQEAWWAHSILFPDDFVQVPESTATTWNFGVVADFHQNGALGPTMWELDAMPAAAISPDRPTGLQFVGHGGDPNNPVVYGAAIGPIVKNVWYDFVYHVKWSSNADGFFYAWVNGVQKLAYTGPTLYTGDSCYLKLANYHSPTGQPSSVIHDRVIRGSTPNAVALQMLQNVVMTAVPAPDTTPPTTPSGLVASAASSTQINLSWSASTDDVGVTGYRIYRGGVLLITVGAVTSYQNTGLAPATAYSYTVQAIDAAGNASAQSVAASATTLADVTPPPVPAGSPPPPAPTDTTAPSVPTTLKATAVSSTQINLTWTASTDDVGVAGYTVYVNGAALTTTTATSFSHAGLTPGTTYAYQVSAFDAAGNASATTATVSAKTPKRRVIRSDFDGDGKSDIVWRNSATGDIAMWLMNGAATASSATFATVADVSWAVAGAGDFDGDGKADILWRNAAAGVALIWLMNGSTIQSDVAVAAQPGSTWSVAGVGDFDGDGRADILWRDTASGAMTIWLMNGGTVVTAATAFATLADANWTVAGVADFDGNGKDDVLWRNGATGANMLWLMNGGAIARSVTVKAMSAASWTVAGTDDFNGDGKADILWRNTATGQNTVWLMNGAAVSSSAAIWAVADQHWVVAGTGDFDGDGKADILWRNAATGQDSVWFMNGAAATSGPLIGAMTDPAWSIALP